MDLTGFRFSEGKLRGTNATLGRGRKSMSKANSRKTQRNILKKNVEKLQRAGLIGPVDFRKKASPATIRKLEKYRAVLTGKAAAVKAPDLATARRLRKTLGLKGTGKTLIVPREKGEKFRVQKSTGELTSERRGYNPGEKIHKTFSKNFPAPPPKGSNEKLYYTIPARVRGAGRLKRHTFSSFDEMLHYINMYDVSFDEIEDRIEIERLATTGRKARRINKQIHAERSAAVARYKRKRKRGKKAGR